MLKKPDIEAAALVDRLREEYGLQVSELEFLPLGADANTAVYRAVAVDGRPYFLKLRRSAFNPTAVWVPQLLSAQGSRQVILPLQTLAGRPWSHLDTYSCFLYPFVAGRSGFEAALSVEQWLSFGRALKGLHSLILPPELQVHIPVESFSPRFREQAAQLLAFAEHNTFDDPVAAQMAALIVAHGETLRRIINRAAQLSDRLQAQPLERVLCHSDIHAGNLLLAEDGGLYLVDWDDLILAPKERDLMFIGGGVGKIWNTQAEEDLFYQGYGAAHTNQAALAYYRYERIVQDLVAFSEQILLADEGGEDREQGLYYFSSQFQPGDVIDMAFKTDRDFSER